MRDINKEFEEEVINFAKFFDNYRKGEEEYYENLNKKVDQAIKQLEEEN